tara:strand:- start:129 stop:1127 length:999 start_codon:yes stop_codon:yes gene_type:complete
MRNRNYIGGVGKATPFLKPDNSGDYTTEDVVVAIRDNKVTIPKGTYIGVGALNEDFVKIKGISASNYTPQDVLHGLRAQYTSWYKDNESKDNYGYTDPKTFIKDTYTNNTYYMSSKADDNLTTGGGADILNATDEQLDKYLEDLTQRVISKDKEDGNKKFATTEKRVESLSAGIYNLITPGHYKSYYPSFTLPLPETPRKIEPRKVTSIEINEDEPNITFATMPEFPDAGPSKADLFFQGLETAKVYENRPDEFSDDAAKNVKGKKTVKTQYIFSDENPFKPKGKYFMSSANTKGKRKKDGNLNKAREWERKNGLGVQKDIAGYIPNLEFGG